MAALGSQSIASSYEQLLHVDADGGGNSTTHVSVKDGDNGTTFGFTIASDALMMSSTNRLEFGDTGTYIHQSADGVLDLVSDTEIEINATTIDMNGAADLSGNLTVGGDIDLEGSIDVNGTSNLDAVDIDGAVQIDSTVTVGADDTGYDVIFYGDTASSNMTWDTSEDDLVLNDATLYINQDDNVKAVNIDSESTTTNVVGIDADALTTGNALSVSSASSSNGTRSLINIKNENAGATGTIGLLIQQDAAANGISIDQNGNGDAINIDFEGTSGNCIDISNATSTTGTILKIQNANALTTGGCAEFHSDSSDTSTRSVVQIANDNSSATGATALNVQQDSTAWALKIDANANGGGLYIDSEATSSAAILIDTPACTTNPVFEVTGCNSLTTAGMASFYSNASTTDSRSLLLITNDHASADGAVTLKTVQDGGSTSVLFHATDASYASDMQLNRATGRSASSSFKFLHCYTDGDSDSQHQLTGDGVTHNRSGTFSAADYAEYFESKDGKVIAVGTTVKLDGDKIVACEDGDTPLGVIRPTGLSIVGNSAWSHWQDKYLMDDYGSPVMEEYTVTEWMEDTDKIITEAVEAKDAVLYEEGDELPEGKKVGDVKEEAVEAQAVVYMHKDIQYHTDKIPSDVTVPDNAIVTSTEKDGRKLMRKKLNPDFVENVDEDGFQIYSSREERGEWHIVGLLGQIPVTKGQPTSSNWIKIKDVSDTVEMYFVK